MAMQISAKRWQDQVILLLGLWLFVTPWVFSYALDSKPASNAFIAGAVIALLAALDLYKTYLWAVILNLVVGVWVAIAPWVMKVSDQPVVTANELIVGIAVVVLALWELRSDPELHKQWAGSGTAG